MPDRLGVSAGRRSSQRELSFEANRTAPPAPAGMASRSCAMPINAFNARCRFTQVNGSGAQTNLAEGIVPIRNQSHAESSVALSCLEIWAIERYAISIRHNHRNDPSVSLPPDDVNSES